MVVAVVEHPTYVHQRQLVLVSWWLVEVVVPVLPHHLFVLVELQYQVGTEVVCPTIPSVQMPHHCLAALHGIRIR